MKPRRRNPLQVPVSPGWRSLALAQAGKNPTVTILAVGFPLNLALGAPTHRSVRQPESDRSGRSLEALSRNRIAVILHLRATVGVLGAVRGTGTRLSSSPGRTIALAGRARNGGLPNSPTILWSDDANAMNQSPR